MCNSKDSNIFLIFTRTYKKRTLKYMLQISYNSFFARKKDFKIALFRKKKKLRKDFRIDAKRETWSIGDFHLYFWSFPFTNRRIRCKFLYSTSMEKSRKDPRRKWENRNTTRDFLHTFRITGLILLSPLPSFLSTHKPPFLPHEVRLSPARFSLL